MTLEEALIQVGSRPLAESPYSQAIQAIVKAAVGKRGVTITKDTPGHEVLSIVYRVTSTSKRDLLLNRNLGTVRGTDTYKQAVVFMAVCLVVIAIIISTVEVLSDTPISADYADVIKTILSGLFEVFKLWMESQQTPTPSL